MQPPADFLKEQGQAAKDIATEAGLEQPARVKIVVA